jgi:drug/metabolite transporter (DMT)-like permease
MSSSCAELLLAAVIAARSISYLLEKVGLESIAPFTLLGIRFLIAFVFLGLVFWQKIRGASVRALRKSALLGGALFLVMACELQGLQTVSSSMASFLENTAVVFVPLMEAVIHHRWPKRQDMILSGAILAGVALLVLQPNQLAGGLSMGSFFCMLAAVLYAGWIILTAYSVADDSPLVIGILSLGFVSLFSIGGAFLFETVTIPGSAEQWGIILGLAFVCSAFGFTLQPVAQQYVPVKRVGMFCALNPVVAALLGWLFLQERIDGYGLAGAAIIIGSLLVSQHQISESQQKQDKFDG